MDTVEDMKTTINDDSFLSSFITGLHTDIKTFVMMTNPKNLKEAEERVCLAEALCHVCS